MNNKEQIIELIQTDKIDIDLIIPVLKAGIEMMKLESEINKRLNRYKYLQIEVQVNEASLMLDTLTF